MTRIDRIEGELFAGGQRFAVLRYDLQLRLSAVDRLTCNVVVSDQDLPDAESLVGALARLRLRRIGDESSLHYTGEVVSAVLRRSDSGVDTLTLDVRPHLWRLGARKNSRVFQEQTVQDIVTQVFNEGGVPATQQDWQLAGSYPQLTYVTQYQETDLEFCSRLLAEAGIYFACRYDADEEERVLFGDEPGGFGPVSGGPESLPFATNFGSEGARDIVANVTRKARVRPARVTVRDYDPTRPRLEIEAEDQGVAEDAALEVYAFPARTLEPEGASMRAERFRESLESDRTVVTGETGALHLAPGASFEITDHPWAPLNGTYAIYAFELSGTMGRQFAVGEETQWERHTFTFEAVPTTLALRPPPRPPARVAPGIHLGLTTGPSGEEIHTDEHGRVTAQFHWDRDGLRDENSSCWMRTSQIPTGGSLLIPRVGWEVALRYVEGDVDRPLVLERLYNGRTPPPYSLPANAARSSLQTATTPGGGSSNELRMSDVRGEEQMFFNASRDMSVQVGNNMTQSVGNDLEVTVGSNQTIGITDSLRSTVGADQSLTVGAGQNVSVGTLMVDDVSGNHSLTVGANQNRMIGGDHRRTVEGDSSTRVGGNDIALVVGDVSDTTLANYSHDVGAAYIQMTADNRSLLVGGARSETTGAAKVILAKGNRGVEAGLLSAQIGGALIAQIKGDSTDSAAIAYSETVAGVTTIKAKNVVFEATALLSFTMGGASIVLTPASVDIAGASVKLEGNVVETGIVIDN